MSGNLKIAFLGTPDFAVPSLEILLKNGYHITCVITAPDKPSGRGLQVNQSEIKKFAQHIGIKVLQPVNLKDEFFLNELKQCSPDLMVVVAFRMLPETIWKIPRLGTFNLHASLLPQYRGAAPINWAIINGEETTGVTTFFINQKIDTGNMIFQEKIAIGPGDTAGYLHDRLKEMGADLVLKTVNAIENENFTQKPQPEFKLLKPAPKINKNDCRINWNSSVTKINNLIRGLSPYPGAWAVVHHSGNEKSIKIYSSVGEISKVAQSIGSIHSDNKCFLKVAVNDGVLSILEVQMEGKRKISIKEFLNGCHFNESDRFL